jgi:hypothetical protein
MKNIFGFFLMIISLLIGVLVDMNFFIEVRLPIFSSFVIFLLGIYLLIEKKD